MAVIVQKYGGTSVQDHELVLRVAHRVADLRTQGNDVVVVVSARGETTDRLVQEARRFTDAPEQRELDMLMSAGERISMSLLAIALNSIGCPAVSFTGSQAGIITDTRHTDARVLEVRPFRVVRELERGNVVVVGGFQGVSTAKDVTTLGRGGSDTTAVALAAALKADLCEILTDVDAVYTADPRVVPAARAIDEIAYDDMAELARFGARILKEEAVRFAERNGIRIRIAGSNSDAAGTIILKEPHGEEPPIIGLSLLEDHVFLSAPSADHDRTTSWMEPKASPLLIVHSGDRIEIVVSGLADGIIVPDDTAREGISGLPTGVTAVNVDVVSIVGSGAARGGVITDAIAELEVSGTKCIYAVTVGRLALLVLPIGSGARAELRLHDSLIGTGQ